MPLDTPASPARAKESIRKPLSQGDARALARRASSALRRVSRAYGKRDARVAYLEQRIADTKTSTTKAVENDLALIMRIMKVLGPYVETNRFVLTNRDRRKSVAFPDGMYRWQPRSYTEIPDVLVFFEEVKRLRLEDKFIRTTEEPNRRAMLEAGNKDDVERLTSARIVDETRPQLVVPGIRLLIEGVRREDGEAFEWRVVDPQDRER